MAWSRGRPDASCWERLGVRPWAPGSTGRRPGSSGWRTNCWWRLGADRDLEKMDISGNIFVTFSWPFHICIFCYFLVEQVFYTFWVHFGRVLNDTYICTNAHKILVALFSVHVWENVTNMCKICKNLVCNPIFDIFGRIGTWSETVMIGSFRSYNLTLTRTTT
jgi:hypothetical protein